MNLLHKVRGRCVLAVKKKLLVIGLEWQSDAPKLIWPCFKWWPQPNKTPKPPSTVFTLLSSPPHSAVESHAAGPGEAAAEIQGRALIVPLRPRFPVVVLVHVLAWSGDGWGDPPGHRLISWFRSAGTEVLSFGDLSMFSVAQSFRCECSNTDPLFLPQSAYGSSRIWLIHCGDWVFVTLLVHFFPK